MFKTPAKPEKEKPPPMPENLTATVQQALANKKYGAAVRALSAVVAGRYMPRRKTYELLWDHMLRAEEARDAYQCYEALKLLQGTFPAGEYQAYCPRTANEDYPLLEECLLMLGPEEAGDSDDDGDDEDGVRSGQGRVLECQFPQWCYVRTVHGAACPRYKQGERVTREPKTEYLAKKPHARCKVKNGCAWDDEPSPFYAELLQYYVSLLTEDARALGPERAAEAAIVTLLTPDGNMDRAKDVMDKLVTGIASMQLPRSVSDTYFALLHLIVEVCGSPYVTKLSEEGMYVWMARDAAPVLEAAAENFNDSLAELLQRTRWWNMKLRFINSMLMSRFDMSEVKHTETREADAQAKSGQASRMIHVYFHLRTKQSVATGVDEVANNETLVLLVASAWQCAKALEKDQPELWASLIANADLINDGFDVFERKISRLKNLRRGTQGSQNASEQSERISVYMTLLRALIGELVAEADGGRGHMESSPKRNKV